MDKRYKLEIPPHLAVGTSIDDANRGYLLISGDGALVYQWLEKISRTAAKLLETEEL